MNINYKSDFDCILTVKDCHENDIGFPTFDFEAKFYTRSLSAYRVSCINGVFTNCFNDNGKIHCVFQNHKLGPGNLMVEFHSIIPDSIYTDEVKNIYSPQETEITLISGKGDCADELEMQVMPNIVVINTGEGGGGQLPDEWPELKKQIETALADMASLEGTVSENETIRGTNEQQRETDEATRRENEKLRTDTEELRQTNEGKRIEAESNRISSEETRVRSESTRKSSEGTRVEAEDERVEAEGIRMQNEEARIEAERSRAEAETTRAETFATYAPKIDAKMNKFDVGAGLQLEGGVLSATGGGSGGGGTGEVVSFRKMWIEAGGTYNEQTGLYGLNGIDDITEEEAMKIWRLSEKKGRADWNQFYYGGFNSSMMNIMCCRTYLPLLINGYYPSNFKLVFSGNAIVEQINIKGGYDSGGGSINISLNMSFYNCKNLKRITFGNGEAIASMIVENNSFFGCSGLERISNFRLNQGGNILNLSYSPKFEIDCIEKCVELSATSAKENSIILHPDVYAQCTEELLAAAAAKNIIISTTE